MQKRSKILITEHARQRLAERLPEIKASEYNRFVSSARYNGSTLHDLRKQNPKVASYIINHFSADNSTKLRLYRNCIFVFSGNHRKAHTLVTVVNVDNI